MSERLSIEKKSIVQVLQEAGYDELTYRMHYLRFADKIQSKYLYFMDMMTVNKTHGKNTSLNANCTTTKTGQA